ncbi:hypothetical protein KP509_08G039100 [Ceratopteris richardii]|uniref:PRONE domain-containing protein n=1 Tax=Ceratopteris richardii TaxID=49495 RepID=A0A8T2UBQ9_CERRI|nr:hypothetical protein KP509_08G039100 [Ceratopteris richardii]
MGQALLDLPPEQGDRTELAELEEHDRSRLLRAMDKEGSWRLSVDNGSSEGMSSSVSCCLGDLHGDDYNIEEEHEAEDDEDDVGEEEDMMDGASVVSSDASSPLGWPLGRSIGTLNYTPGSCSGSSDSTSRVIGTPTRRALFSTTAKTSSFPSLQALSRHAASASPHHLHFQQRKDLSKSRAHMSEVELMKERFAKLLLGEDMSGGAKGVTSALAISNAITNLSASVFGEIWRLEPLSTERKMMWKREMEWLLSVADYVVELVPSWQTFPDGHDLEVMVSRPRSDLNMNLPALKKLDTMLVESLDTFNGSAEFWYVEQDSAMSDHEDSQLTMPLLQRQEEKWWLPSPKVPPSGLSHATLKHLRHQRECVNQILKAALSINNQTLSEMEVPQVYWESLPKNGKASVGEQMYKQIAAQYFSAEAILCSSDLSTVHSAWEVANGIEAAVHVWRRKRQRKARARRRLLLRHGHIRAAAAAHHSQPLSGSAGKESPSATLKFDAKASWSLVRDLVLDMDRREMLASRGESLLLCIRQKFPDLPQSLLDRLKIQYNKDVGQSILESYSRVLESLASNIIARIDDVLHVDQMTRRLIPK